MTRKLNPQVPGEPPQADDPALDGADDEAVGPDDDAAVEAGRQGRARRVAKPRAPVAPADLGDRADTTRPPSAGINTKPQASYDEAMEQDRMGKLQRSVLTEKGWYVPQNSLRERMARKKQGEAEFVQIDWRSRPCAES